MIRCGVCGAENRDNAKFCRKCGTGMSPVDKAPRPVESPSMSASTGKGRFPLLWGLIAVAVVIAVVVILSGLLSGDRATITAGQSSQTMSGASTDPSVEGDDSQTRSEEQSSNSSSSSAAPEQKILSGEEKILPSVMVNDSGNSGFSFWMPSHNGAAPTCYPYAKGPDVGPVSSSICTSLFTDDASSSVEVIIQYDADDAGYYDNELAQYPEAIGCESSCVTSNASMNGLDLEIVSFNEHAAIKVSKDGMPIALVTINTSMEDGSQIAVTTGVVNHIGFIYAK